MKKLRVTVNGKVYDVTVEVLEDESIDKNNGHHRQEIVHKQEIVHSQSTAKPVASETSAPKMAANSGGVASPMTGVILRCDVKEGDNVTVDQPLLVLEAMKMESIIPSPGNGVVTSLRVKAGDAVQEGQLLLTIE